MKLRHFTQCSYLFKLALERNPNKIDFTVLGRVCTYPYINILVYVLLVNNLIYE